MEKIYVSKKRVQQGVLVIVLIVLGLVWLERDGQQEMEISWSDSEWEQESSLMMMEITEESEKRWLGVHVTGAVQNPDRVYYLQEGARIGEAIEAAGGADGEADLSQLNLAGYIQDGQRIYVPRQGEAVEETNQPEENAETLLTNINLATKIELLELPGIGEAYAQRILDYREKNGPFKAIEDIMNVKGIGESKFAEFKDRITVK